MDNAPFRQLNRAQALANQGRVNEAIETLDMVSTLDADQPGVGLRQNEIHLALRDGATAHLWLSRAKAEIQN